MKKEMKGLYKELNKKKIKKSQKLNLLEKLKDLIKSLNNIEMKLYHQHSG